MIDADGAKAEALARAVAEAGQGATRAAWPAMSAALAAADGVINCTPLGMHGYPGSPVPEGCFPTGAWAFDAVYTPVETPFRARPLPRVRGSCQGGSLFFHQGIDAFEIFTDRRPGDLVAAPCDAGRSGPGARVGATGAAPAPSARWT